MISILTKNYSIQLRKDCFSRKVWNRGETKSFVLDPDNKELYDGLRLTRRRLIYLGLYRLEITSEKRFKDIKNISSLYPRPAGY